MKHFNTIALLLSVSIVSAHNDYNGSKDPYRKNNPSKSCNDKTVTKTVCLTKTVSACPNPIPSNIYVYPKDVIFRKHKNKPSKNGVRNIKGEYEDPYKNPYEDKEKKPHKEKKEKKEKNPYKEEKKEKNPYKEEKKEKNPYKEEKKEKDPYEEEEEY